MLERTDPQPLITAAQSGNEDAFHQLTEPYRRELLVHCYRLLGSTEDAEDLLQETLLRAWRRLDTFVRNVSFRAWLYKIATNACLNALAKRPKRTLPDTLSTSGDPRERLAPPVTEPIWLQPFPDEWLPERVADAATDPEARYSNQESISLAFILALQLLPPRQRAVLILSDVLDWRATEVADLLGLTVSSVNSALHRARETLAKNRADEPEPIPLDNDATRHLLEQFVRAMENADVAGIVALLKADAVFSMPPSPTWYQGPETVWELFANQLFGGEAKGRWRLLPAQANLQPAFGLYRLDEASGKYRPYAVQVLTLEAPSGPITEVVSFSEPRLFAWFGLPSEL
jgi:RNA polymerase sigma-70 factor, ECF subfamily